MTRFGAILFALVSSISAIGCSAVSDNVSVYPVVLRFSDVNRRLTSVSQLVENREFGRALEISWTIDERANPSVRELATLGQAEVAGGRFEQGRRHLEKALSMNPSRQTLAEIHWDLSQADYLQNRFQDASENAQLAAKNGLKIRQWAIDLLRALSTQHHVLRVAQSSSDFVAMKFGRPAIPRIQTTLNRSHDVEGVIDTGAVFTIVSRSLADRAGIRSLEVRGTLLGLLGEPIGVEYGILDHLRIGGAEVENLPVAIMPDNQLTFFVVGRQRFDIDLLLGTNLLKQYRIELDYRRERVRLTPLEMTSNEGPRDDQNLFYVDYRPMIHAAIDRHGWYLFLLDTGSEITFLNRTMMTDENLRHWSKLHGATLQGLGGSMKRGSNLQDVEIGVAGWAGAFPTIPLYASEPPAFGIIGQNFLRHFNVVIDFGKMRIDLIEGT